MKVFSLENELWIPFPPREVFQFFADPRNLEQLTPPWLRFQVLNPDVEMRAGARIEYKLRLHGVPLRWQSEITKWEPPFRFVDAQTHGPYRLWIHEHSFEGGNGGTLVRDHVQYAVPGGTLVRKLFVAPDLDRIFRFRTERLKSIFGSAA